MPLSDDVYATGIATIFAAHLGLKEPERDKFKIGKKLLDHIPDNIFMQACLNVSYLTSVPYPYSIVALVNDEAKKLMGGDADSSYALIEKMITRFYDPNFGKASTEVIELKLKEAGRSDLFELAMKWGDEIYRGGNPTATRAQFKKSFEQEYRLASGNSQKQLGEPVSLKELLPKFDEEK
jgi:hypothetical protein